jgi:hypothetical protein
MKFNEYINILVEEGYKKTAILDQIKKACGLRSRRALFNWMSESSVPDVYRAQMVAAYLSKKLGKRITVSDIWPVDGLKEVV